jgi:hypothetical protein
MLDADEGGEPRSNSSLKRPVVSQPSSEASTMFLSSWAPMTLPEGAPRWPLAGTAVAPRRWRRIRQRVARFVRAARGFCLFSMVSFLCLFGRQCLVGLDLSRGELLHIHASGGLRPVGDELRACFRFSGGASSGGCVLWRYRASGKPLRGGARQHRPAMHPAPTRRPFVRRSSRTGLASSSLGPKFQPSA